MFDLHHRRGTTCSALSEPLLSPDPPTSMIGCARRNTRMSFWDGRLDLLKDPIGPAWKDTR